MILRDRPENEQLSLPSDNLSRNERLARLFSGIDDRWRLLAVLTLDSGPSDLMKPELIHLARIYGPAGLAVRLVFLESDDINSLERELAFWKEEHIVATGDNIHARRFLDYESDALPCLKLFTPGGSLKTSFSGFDTEAGLDPLCRILTEKTDINCEKIPGREKRVNSSEAIISSNHQS